MYNRVSRELRDKLQRDRKKITVYSDDYNSWDDLIMLKFDSTEQELYKECIKWKHVVNLYFLHTHSGGSLKKFLNYNYIRPHKIFHSTVTFNYNINWDQSWRDWFIVNEEKDYASIVTT